VTRNTLAPAFKGLVLCLLALAAGLRPAWGAPLPDGRAAGSIEVDSCCFVPDDGGCCPGNDGTTGGPNLRPLCCGFDAPANRPAERGETVTRSPLDPTAVALHALARGQADQRTAFDFVRSAFESREDREDAAHAPPVPAADTAPAGCHWVTERDVLAALALLSVARP
jgi:hypothetical protein